MNIRVAKQMGCYGTLTSNTLLADLLDLVEGQYDFSDYGTNKVHT